MTKADPSKLRQARILAVQTLFQFVAPSDELTKDEAIEFALLAGNDPEKGYDSIPDDYFYELVDGVIANQPQIDEAISKYLTNWNFDRVTALDLTILRLAFYEIQFKENPVPIKVAINEAIEVSKVFSDDKSRRFISGILGKLSQSVD
ncbi:transcription antitermination factor NusB [Fundicoccus culcitae]|uniref:Transcription antitermination protein NusB n=1 Tax=Fundicoccus culcitae TaxID=2969821 RepID=A0ABY5P663_9LACT|nr:transcription antitermination factor NusB [Fundicoccus culcitae]UUX34237.1 transcription antitermination factor NusB [Fundicoccus culcitae]